MVTLVVRLLPPTLKNEDFLESISDWLDKISYYEYINGQRVLVVFLLLNIHSHSQNKSSVNAMCYLNFSDLSIAKKFALSFHVCYIIIFIHILGAYIQ